MRPSESIQCIAYPRSGHQLLANLLLKYYSRDLEYPNTDDINVFTKGINDTVLEAGAFNYCEFYGHCNRVPCTDPRTNFQKNHDLELNLAKDKSNRYIIQYRHPVEAVVSFYKANILRKERFGQGSEDSWQGWFDFIEDSNFKRKIGFWRRIPYRSIPGRILYWKLFVKKWIGAQKVPNVYYLSYADLINNPVGKLKEVISFINLSVSTDIDFIEQVVFKQGIHGGRNTGEKLKKFKYYNESFFRQIEDSVFSELQSLKIKRIFRKD